MGIQTGPGRDTARRLTIGALLALSAPAACTCGEGSGVDRSSGRLPQLEARRAAQGAFEIDGALDEAAWRATGSTGPFVSVGDGREDPSSGVQATARIAWDERMLHVGATVEDDDPVSPFDRDEVDPHVWERSSAIEVMIQPGDPGDNTHYYEIQVDVNGAVWDTRFDDYNRPVTPAPGGGKRFGHQDWSSELRRAVEVDRDAGRYTLELAIPWSAFDNPRGAVPPEPGDVWRVNLYSFRDGQRDSLAWSPILGEGNFHRASRFGRVRFGGN